MRALFAIYFAGMGSKGMVECLAIDVLRVVGQMLRTEGGRSLLTRYGMAKRSLGPRRDDAAAS